MIYFEVYTNGKLRFIRASYKDIVAARNAFLWEHPEGSFEYRPVTVH